MQQVKKEQMYNKISQMETSGKLKNDDKIIITKQAHFSSFVIAAFWKTKVLIC